MLIHNSRPITLVVVLMVFTISSFLPRTQALVYGTTATLTEWAIPTSNSNPGGMILDPETLACCWFVEFSGNKIVRFDQSANSFQEWVIPTPSSSPMSLSGGPVVPEKVIFGTEFTGNKVFGFLPSSGLFIEFPLPTADSGPNFISWSAESNHVWFSETGTTGTRNFVAELDADTNSLREIILPIEAGGGANGVVALPSNNGAWFAGYSALLKWNNSLSRFTTYPIPSHPSTFASGFIQLLPGGVVLYDHQTIPTTPSSTDYIGMLSPPASFFKEWQVPTTGADPKGIAWSWTVGGIWFAEYMGSGSKGKIGFLDVSNASSGAVHPATPIQSPPYALVPTSLTPSGTTLTSTTTTSLPVNTTLTGSISAEFLEFTLGDNSHPWDLQFDSSGSIWILERGSNKIARLIPTQVIPEFPLGILIVLAPVLVAIILSARYMRKQTLLAGNQS